MPTATVASGVSVAQMTWREPITSVEVGAAPPARRWGRPSPPVPWCHRRYRRWRSPCARSCARSRDHLLDGGADPAGPDQRDLGGTGVTCATDRSTPAGHAAHCAVMTLLPSGSFRAGIGKCRIDLRGAEGRGDASAEIRGPEAFQARDGDARQRPSRPRRSPRRDWQGRRCRSARVATSRLPSTKRAARSPPACRSRRPAWRGPRQRSAPRCPRRCPR